MLKLGVDLNQGLVFALVVMKNTTTEAHKTTQIFTPNKTMNLFKTPDYEPLDFSDYDYNKERFAGLDPSPTYEEFLEEKRDSVIEEKARRAALTDKEREAEDARIAKILSDEAEAKAAYDLKWADCPF